MLLLGPAVEVAQVIFVLLLELLAIYMEELT
jgi:hypothetical protein